MRRIILILLCFVLVGIAGDFRDVNLGEEIGKRKDMKKVGEMNECVEFYEKINEDTRIGNAEVEKIYYITIDNKLVSIRIYFDKEAYNKLLNYYNKFSTPKITKLEGLTIYIWKTPKLQITLTHIENQQKGIIEITKKE
jgi:hypothetical protein